MNDLKGRPGGQIGYDSPPSDILEQMERDSSLYKTMKKMGFMGGLLFNYLKDIYEIEQLDPAEWDSKPLDVWLKDAFEGREE